MQQFGRVRMAVGAAAWLAMIGAAQPALANRTAIDGSQENVVTVCTTGAASACATPTALTTPTNASPLVVDFGFGPFSSVYIYNNGFVSIGAPIAPGTDFSSFANFGAANVFTPGYSPTASLFSAVFIQGPQTPQSEHPGAQNQVVRVTFCHDANACSSDDTTEQFSIFDLGSGDYRLDFEYGAFSDTDAPDVPQDAYAGYSFGGSGNMVSGAALQDKTASPNLFEYTFRATATPGVPEPATWAMLLCGFTAVGAAMRQRGRVPLALG